jgi:hypothetical protein
MRFLDERVQPFVEFWAGIINAINKGEGVNFVAKDIPPWTNPE